jgi:hypothetical protein
MISYSEGRRWVLDQQALPVASKMPDTLNRRILSEHSNRTLLPEALSLFSQVIKFLMWHHSQQRAGQNKLRLENIHTIRPKLPMSHHLVFKRTRLFRNIDMLFQVLSMFYKVHRGHQLKVLNNSRSKLEG